jgi:hypothetical protein
MLAYKHEMSREQRPGGMAAVEADLHGPGAEHYDLLLHCGDLAYDMDSSNGRNGDAFMAGAYTRSLFSST